jgi:hypothetical protein
MAPKSKSDKSSTTKQQVAPAPVVKETKKDSHKESHKDSHKESHKDSHKDSHKKKSHKDDKEDEEEHEVKPKQKREEKTGSDKGLNKETIMVGLMFNVKPFKTWLKTYYKNTNRDSVKIINAHYMMAAMNEVFIFNMLTGASDMIKKQQNGLLDLTLERFLMYIQRTDHLLTTFGQFHSKYEPGFDYSKQMPLDKKIMDKFIEKKCFHKNQSLHINKDTMNYLYYLVAQVNTHCAEIAYVFSHYAKKTTVTGEGIKASIEIFFNGKLLVDVMTKLEQITNILKNKSKKDSDKGEDKEEEKKDKKEIKKKLHSDDDDEDDVSEASEAEPDSEEESEEESEDDD